MLPAIRKTRRALWNLQRQLGTVILIMEFFTGAFARAGKKVANKLIGRNIVRRLILRR